MYELDMLRYLDKKNLKKIGCAIYLTYSCALLVLQSIVTLDYCEDLWGFVSQLYIDIIIRENDLKR